MAKELKPSDNEALDQFVRSLELSHFSAEESGSVLSGLGDISSWIDHHFQAKDRDGFLARSIFSQEKWADPKRIGQMIEEKRELLSLAQNVFTQPFSKSWTDLFGRLLENADEQALKQIFHESRLVFRAESTRIVRALIQKSTSMYTDGDIAEVIMSEEWAKKKETPDLIRKLIKSDMNHGGQGAPIARLLGQPLWAGHSEGLSLLRALSENPKSPIYVYTSVLSKPEWIKQPGAEQIMVNMMQKGLPYFAEEWVFSHLTDWDRHPALPKFAELLIRGEAKSEHYPPYYLTELFKRTEWNSHPQLKELCGGKLVEPICLREAFNRGATFLGGESCKAGIVGAIHHAEVAP